MKYYLLLYGKKSGPFEKKELKSKGIAPNDYVWAEGLDDWTKACEVEDLNDVVTLPPRLAPLPPMCPKTYVAESIGITIILFLLCTPLCFASAYGIIKASSVSEKYYNGQFDEAEQASRKARKWSLYPLIACGVLYLLFIALVFAGIISKYTYLSDMNL